MSRVAVIKNRSEFSNNSVFNDIKGNILKYLITNKPFQNLKENLKK